MNRNKGLALAAIAILVLIVAGTMQVEPEKASPEIAVEQIRSNVDVLPAEPRLNMQVFYPERPNDPNLSATVQNNFRGAEFKEACQQYGVKTLMHRSDTRDYVHRYSKYVPSPMQGDPAVYTTDADGRYYKLYVGQDAVQAVTAEGVKNVVFEFQRYMPQDSNHNHASGRCIICPKPKPDPKPDDDDDLPAPEPLPVTPLPNDNDFDVEVDENFDIGFALLSLGAGLIGGWAIMFRKG